MKHYLSERWIDFARGTLPESEKEAMRLHLDSGCYDCRDLSETWQRVRELARREPHYQIPESVVTHVKNAFLVERHRRSRKKITIPRLTFDSLWDALPVGVRASGVSARSLQFQTDTLLIHLSIDPNREQQLVSVDGQLVDATGQNRTLDNIPVNLLEDERALSQTQTNRFGEFQLEYKPNPGVKNAISIGEAEETVVPLAMTPEMSRSK